MAEEYPVVHLCRGFCTRSSADGHVGRFHAPAVVNSAAVSSGVCVSFSVLVSSGT